MAVSTESFDSSYQRHPGFRRVKAKASGNSLADSVVQQAVHRYRSPSEETYVLGVLWVNNIVHVDLRDGTNGLQIVSALADSEGRAWGSLYRSMNTLGIS